MAEPTEIVMVLVQQQLLHSDCDMVVKVIPSMELHVAVSMRLVHRIVAVEIVLMNRKKEAISMKSVHIVL